MSAFWEKFRSRWWGDVQGDGGCETCGYGAERGMSEEEYVALLEEMDEWIKETFGGKK